MKSKIQKWATNQSGRYPVLYSLKDVGKMTKNAGKKAHKINDVDNFNPFFIIGSGRSGNTLLRTMLSKEETVVIPPESFVLGEAIRKYKLYKFMEWEDLVSVFCGVFERHHGFPRWQMDTREFYKEALQIPEKKRNLEYLIHVFYMYYASDKKEGIERWGDKTPINTFHLKPINKVFKDSQFVHIIRDGRDVVSSYVKAGLYDEAEEAANRWSTSVDLARDFGEKVGDKRYHEVFYEDLVRQPEVEIKKICSFLNLEYRESMLDNTEGVENLGDTYLSHHKNLHNPINDSSVGKWKKDMNERDKVVVQSLLHDKLQNLGY